MLPSALLKPTPNQSRRSPNLFVSEQKSKSESRSRDGSRRVWVFRLLFVLLGLAPFLALEIGLRVLQVGETDAPGDPFAGFNARNPLFQKVDDVYRTSRFRGQFFPEQEFAAEKPADEFRIFCLGGSTVYGKPFLADTAFPKWLELELNARQPKKRIKAVNCGGISYASHRLLHVAREVAQYSPDLIVLATGHNEFLEDRTYYSLKSRSETEEWIDHTALSLKTVALARRWLGKDKTQSLAPSPDQVDDASHVGDVVTRLDDRIGFASFKRDDAWRTRVATEFDAMLREIVDVCRTADIPLILVRLGSNLRDCPPFKSEHRPGLSPEDERRWRDAFDEGGRLDPADPANALAAYRRAEAIDNRHAQLQYRIARCLDRLNRSDEARIRYLNAKNEDICALRMLDEFGAIVARTAEVANAPLVDVQDVLDRAAPEGIPGFDLYLDHVHPCIGGHQRIAAALAAAPAIGSLLDLSAPFTPQRRRSAFAAHFAALPRNYFSNGRRRLEWLDQWAQRQRLLDEITPRDAAGFVRQGMRRYEFANAEGAWSSFDQALKLDHAVAVNLLKNYADELRAQGRPGLGDKLEKRLSRIGAR